MRAICAMLLMSAAAAMMPATLADARERPRIRASSVFATPSSSLCATGVLRRRAGRAHMTCSGRGLLYAPRDHDHARRQTVWLRQVPRWAVAHSGEDALRGVMLRECGWLAHDRCRTRLDRSGRLQRVLGLAEAGDDAEILSETGFPAVDEVPPVVFADPPSRYERSRRGFLPP